MLHIVIRQLEENLFSVSALSPMPGLAVSSEFCETDEEVLLAVKDMLDEYKTTTPAANGG